MLALKLLGRGRTRDPAAKLFEGVTLNSLRHTHTSLVIAARVDVKAFRAWLDHADIRVTLDISGHLLPGQEERAAASLDQPSRVPVSLTVVRQYDRAARANTQ